MSDDGGTTITLTLAKERKRLATASDTRLVVSQHELETYAKLHNRDDGDGGDPGGDTGPEGGDDAA